jgi:hypothetical protein
VAPYSGNDLRILSQEVVGMEAGESLWHHTRVPIQSHGQVSRSVERQLLFSSRSGSYLLDELGSGSSTGGSRST